MTAGISILIPTFSVAVQEDRYLVWWGLFRCSRQTYDSLITAVASIERLSTRGNVWKLHVSFAFELGVLRVVAAAHFL